MEFDEQVEQANRRAREFADAHPRAEEAHYDSRMGQIVVRLSSRLNVMFSPQDAEGLQGATPAQLEPIEISPSGFGIHFPKLDADLYLPALLEGFLGSKRWMAGRLGASGGKSKSAAKALAARKNGRAGGRPRKAARVAAAEGS
ncbi:MAG: DUF2442 domain-containing protein [Terracidiphilus sp.]|jgi:hypothetical protein